LNRTVIRHQPAGRTAISPPYFRTRNAVEKDSSVDRTSSFHKAGPQTRLFAEKTGLFMTARRQLINQSRIYLN
jgi:hypothetical protein